MKKLHPAIGRRRFVDAAGALPRAEAELWRILDRIPRSRERGHPGNMRRALGFAMASHKLREILRLRQEVKKYQRFARS